MGNKNEFRIGAPKGADKDNNSHTNVSRSARGGFRPIPQVICEAPRVDKPGADETQPQRQGKKNKGRN